MMLCRPMWIRTCACPPPTLPGVDPARETETLVQLEIASSLPGWERTHILLRTGRGFRRDRKEVMGISLFDGPLSPYGAVIQALARRDHTAFVPEGAPQLGWRIMDTLADEMANAPLDEY